MAMQLCDSSFSSSIMNVEEVKGLVLRIIRISIKGG